MQWKSVVIKAILGIVLLLVIALAGLWGYNFAILQMPMNKVLAESAEAEIGVRVHFVRYFQTDKVVFNITSTGGEQVAQRALKLFFDFAARLKDQDFGEVRVALNNRVFLVVPGDTFQKLGKDFGTVPLVEQIRTLGQTATLPGGRPIGSVDRRILKHFLGGILPGPKEAIPGAPPSPEPGAAAPEGDAPPAEDGAAAPATGEAAPPVPAGTDAPAPAPATP